MDAQAVIQVVEANHQLTGGSGHHRLTELSNSASELEQAGLLGAARRGLSADEIAQWLQEARDAADDLDASSYEMAMQLFSDSTVLEWKECLDVAPALSYRSPLLEQAAS